jgi:hypothetical protein
VDLFESIAPSSLALKHSSFAEARLDAQYVVASLVIVFFLTALSPISISLSLK